ncbi:MAG: LysR family transcriptional regulator [Polaromonas sp.]|nr:LysR family transcriptional regulator [Polaromonas sp.]
MDLVKSMQVYVAVVEGGSFVAAAERFDTSTASISRQVAALEAHLGARLLQRTTRRLSMSEPGRAFYERAQQILADIAETEAVVGREATQPTGLLRVSVPLSYGVREFARILPAFRARYPGLRLDLDLSDRTVDLVNDSVDVAVRIGGAPGQNLIARKIAPVRIVVCAAPAYLARRGVPHTPEDLAGHDTLSYSWLATGDTWNFRHGDGVEQAVRIEPLVHANNGDLLRELALAGGGIIAQPDFIVAQDLARGALVPLLQDWPMAESHVYAVYLSRKFLSPKVRVFIDFLVESAGGAAAQAAPPA